MLAFHNDLVRAADTALVMLDLSAAFDTVDHDYFWIFCGVSLQLLKFLSSGSDPT